MSRNQNLNTAKRAKQDEFYTQLNDIENELRHYNRHFAGKVVYCNCDDPTVSNFWKYFSLQFERLGLKKLMATCYKNPSYDLFSDHTVEKSFYLEYFGDKNDNRVPDPEEIGVRYLQGDGDFRSGECIELLKEADIVVTNPPFSLFREYVAQLVKYDKKFLIIGNMNAVKYRDIFPLIKENRLWLGYGSVKEFETPKDNGKSYFCEQRNGWFQKFGNVTWFTNLDHKKRKEELILYKRYTPEEYLKFENYDAINVNKTSEIPEKFEGAIGVPITFLDKYNPEQFEILGLGIAGLGLQAGVGPYKAEHKKYRREVQRRGAANGDLYIMVDGVVKVPYSRILIRNKKL